MRDITLDSEETIVSYDVTSFFTCISSQEALKMVKKCLLTGQ